jgi:hypothetical protein
MIPPVEAIPSDLFCNDIDCNCYKNARRCIIILARNNYGLLDLKQLWWKFSLSNTNDDEKKGEPPCEIKVDSFSDKFISYLMDLCIEGLSDIFNNIIFAYIDPSDINVATIAHNPAGGEYIKFLIRSDKRYFERVRYVDGKIVSRSLMASLDESDEC